MGTAEGMIDRLVAATLSAVEALDEAAGQVAPDTLATLAAGMDVGPVAAALDAAGAFGWPDRLGPVRDCLVQAATEAQAATQGLAAAPAEASPMLAAGRALRRRARAEAALYPLAPFLPAVSRHFLEPAARADAALLGRLAAVPPGLDGTGVMHLGGPPGMRGGVALYVPETYDPARPAPLVVALHGGSGNGADFLWTWLRVARSRGMLLVAPTSPGRTWTLDDPGEDGAFIGAILADVEARWPVDPHRRLLAGMSDGGTFTYGYGVQDGAPFTHLAPVAAAFHPMLMMLADPMRLRGLPIHILHGARDWMFPAAMAREAARMLAGAGAAVTHEEVGGMAHVWPQAWTPGIADWFLR
jgi:phospholipase/carboxylesterase